MSYVLGKDDTIYSMWPGTYDGKYGHIVLSKERLLFVEEHGFLQQTAQVVLNLPYYKINNFILHGNHQLNITTKKGEKTHVASPYLSLIKNHLDLYLHKAKSSRDSEYTRARQHV